MTSFTRLVDLSWAALLLATVLLWRMFDGGEGQNAALLMCVMSIKSLLIAVVFMDLWRRSRLALVLLVATMIATGIAILWLSA